MDAGVITPDCTLYDRRPNRVQSTDRKIVGHRPFFTAHFLPDKNLMKIRLIEVSLPDRTSWGILKACTSG